MRYLFLYPLLFLLVGTTPAPLSTQYLPNLRCPPLEMWRGMYISSDEESSSRWLHLTFSGENQGPGHLIVVGEITCSTKEIVLAKQIVGDSDGNWNALPGNASYFKYHGAQHGHWHWHGWATYGLIRLDQAEKVTIGMKQSFCLADTKVARKHVKAPGQPEIPWPNLYVSNLDKTYKVTCRPGRIGTMAQRVSAGHMDVFGPSYNTPIEILSDGIYALVGIIDIKNDIVESNECDNVGILVIMITGKKVYYLGHLELD